MATAQWREVRRASMFSLPTTTRGALDGKSRYSSASLAQHNDRCYGCAAASATGTASQCSKVDKQPSHQAVLKARGRQAGEDPRPGAVGAVGQHRLGLCGVLGLRAQRAAGLLLERHGVLFTPCSTSFSSVPQCSRYYRRAAGTRGAFASMLTSAAILPAARGLQSCDPRMAEHMAEQAVSDSVPHSVWDPASGSASAPEGS